MVARRSGGGSLSMDTEHEAMCVYIDVLTHKKDVVHSKVKLNNQMAKISNSVVG